MERTGDVGNDVEKYIIVNPKTGKGVQSWDFSEPKHIVYCRSPEWTMKFDKEDGVTGDEGRNPDGDRVRIVPLSSEWKESLELYVQILDFLLYLLYHQNKRLIYD